MSPIHRQHIPSRTRRNSLSGAASAPGITGEHVLHQRRTSQIIRYALIVVLTILSLIVCWRCLIAGEMVALAAGLAAIVARFIFFLRFDITSNVSSYIIWTFTDFSFFGVFGIMSSDMFAMYAMEASAFAFTLSLGCGALWIYLIVMLLGNALLGRKARHDSEVIRTTRLSSSTMWFLLVGAFGLGILLLLISYHYGLGKLTGEGVALPFKMGGIIVFMRKLILPFLLLMIAEYGITSKGRRLIVGAITAFVLLGIADGVFSFSKAAITFTMIPLALFIVKIQRLRVVHLLIMGGAILATILAFSQVQMLRNWVKTTSYTLHSFSLSDAKVIDLHDQATTFFTRAFKDGVYTIRFASYWEPPYSEPHFKEIWAAKGTANYHTRVIMHIPLSFSTSLGTGGISDGYMIGGAYFALFTAFVFAVMAVLVDWVTRSFLAGNPTLSAYLNYFVMFTINGGLWELVTRQEVSTTIWLLTPCLLWLAHNVAFSVRRVDLPLSRMLRPTEWTTEALTPSKEVQQT